MNLDIKVDIAESFNRKIDTTNLLEACSETVQTVTRELEQACRDECPVRTGNLRDGHFTSTTALQGNVHNHVHYAKYVIYGTSRQAPNNYPQRAKNRVADSGKIASILQENLQKRGIL